jgi:hypothetical protein
MFPECEFEKIMCDAAMSPLQQEKAMLSFHKALENSGFAMSEAGMMAAFTAAMEAWSAEVRHHKAANRGLSDHDACVLDVMREHEKEYNLSPTMIAEVEQLMTAKNRGELSESAIYEHVRAGQNLDALESIRNDYGASQMVYIDP